MDQKEGRRRLKDSKRLMAERCQKDLKVSNVRECDTKIIKEFMDYGLMWGKEQGGRWSA